MTKPVDLDSTDVHIMNSLGNDGRRSFTDLAQELGVSVGMVRNRYKRLVDEGILHIIGWTNPEKNGMNAYARIIMKVRPTEKIREVADKLTDISEVSFVAITTGTHDLEANVTCRNNRELLRLMHDKIHPIEGVFETSTTLYLEILKWASHKISDRHRKSGIPEKKGAQGVHENVADE